MIDLEIKNKIDCMGCHGCANICPQNCIEMLKDLEGFWYPKVNYTQCIKCRKCIEVCPIINKTRVVNNPTAYACLNTDEETRMDSSSGGIFSLIAEQVLAENGIVFGVEFDDQFNVIHGETENKNELDKFRGSKYVQSEISFTYRKVKDYLVQDRTVLFTGTPCQVSGLCSYLKRPYDNLLCLDNICHGVPSPKVWQKYLAYRERIANSITQRVNFREKASGWKKYSVNFLFENKMEYKKHLREDLYMQAFLKDICLRPSCHECEFKSLHRESDITLGDFWGIQNILPEMDDDKGTSLIFINSKKGRTIFNLIKPNLLYKEVDINQAVTFNSAAIKSVKCHPQREQFFADLDILEFDELTKKYCRTKLYKRFKNKIISIGKKLLKRKNNLNIF